MHISEKLIDESVIPFQNPKACVQNSDFDSKRWIYIPSFYSSCRYILGTVGNRSLITIGINPSTASPNNLDNTLKSVERIAFGNDFDSYIMFNVYAQRATDPSDMHKELDSRLHIENMKAFRYLLEQSEERPMIWAAWGTLIEKRSYLKDCLLEMVKLANEYDARWCRTGNLSKKGHPHHPLYLKKDSKLVPFDIDDYLRKL